MGYDYNNDTEGMDMNVKTGKFKGLLGCGVGSGVGSVDHSVVSKGEKTRLCLHW